MVVWSLVYHHPPYLIVQNQILGPSNIYNVNVKVMIFLRLGLALSLMGRQWGLAKT